MELSKKNLLSLIEKNQINDCKIINLNFFGNELLIDISTSNPTLQSKKSIENSIKKIISENIQEELELKINFKIEKTENAQNQIKGNPIEGIKNVIAIASRLFPVKSCELGLLLKYIHNKSLPAA